MVSRDTTTEVRTTATQPWRVLVAGYLGWTLDAFDFSIMVFVLRQIAATFDASSDSIALAITLTLACRAIGALIFGRLAGRFGRRPILMMNITAFALLSFTSGLAPTLTAFLVLRALFGVAMGGEWGVAASLVMESVPPERRGIASGVLQAGYPTGYLLASLLYLAEPWLGWRGMFMMGLVPALLVLYVRRSVPESPEWLASSPAEQRTGLWTLLQRHARLTVFTILLMTSLNALAHGSLDLYPSVVLGAEHQLTPEAIASVMIATNIGGLVFGALSDRIGRESAIALAVLSCLVVLPLWCGAATPLHWAAVPACCCSACRVPGASSRSFSTSCRRRRSARPYPASSTKQAISSPPRTPTSSCGSRGVWAAMAILIAALLAWGPGIRRDLTQIRNANTDGAIP